MKLRYTLNDPLPVTEDFEMIMLHREPLLVAKGVVEVEDDDDIAVLSLKMRGFVEIDPASEALPAPPPRRSPKRGRRQAEAEGAAEAEDDADDADDAAE